MVERWWYALSETCLAFTIYPGDFAAHFVCKFVLLLYIKCLHWLGDDRVDYMGRLAIVTPIFHIRVLGAFCLALSSEDLLSSLALINLLAIVDVYFIASACFTTSSYGSSAQIVFGFEVRAISFGRCPKEVFSSTVCYSTDEPDSQQYQVRAEHYRFET